MSREISTQNKNVKKIMKHNGVSKNRLFRLVYNYFNIFERLEYNGINYFAIDNFKTLTKSFYVSFNNLLE